MTGIILLLYLAIFSLNLTLALQHDIEQNLPFDKRQHRHQHQHHRKLLPRNSNNKKDDTSKLPKYEKNNELIRRRKEELSKFHKKLFDSIWELFKKSNKNNSNYEVDWDELNEQFNKIRKNLGNGFDVIIYNCTYPTYISIDGKKQVYLSKELSESLKNGDECSEKTDNIWRLKGDATYLTTLDISNQDLSSKLMPFGSLLEIFQHLNICDHFLILTRHPWAYLRTYKKPFECSSQNKGARTTNNMKHVETTTIKASTKSVRFVSTTKLAHFRAQTNRPRFVYTTNPFLMPKFCPGGR